jgi:hypothetical protein
MRDGVASTIEHFPHMVIRAACLTTIRRCFAAGVLAHVWTRSANMGS